MRLLMSVLLGIIFACVNIADASDTAIGSVKKVTGESYIIRGEKLIPAKTGEKLYEGDTLQTEKDGGLGVIFRDNTILSLGPKSRIVIDEFVFDLDSGKLSIITKMLRGTAAYMSGIIAKLSPESAQFKTPLATVGIRGTRFLAKVEGD